MSEVRLHRALSIIAVIFILLASTSSSSLAQNLSLCECEMPHYYGTSSCAGDFNGCINGFTDDQGDLLGPFPVPPDDYPIGTFIQTYRFNADLETSLIYKITIEAQEDWASQFPLAFDFISYENDDFILNPDYEQGVLISQARVERRLVDVPVPVGTTAMSFYFAPQIETRNLAIAIHGLRHYQDPDLSDGDDSKCFTALKEVAFEGVLLTKHTSEFDSDKDGLADGFEKSEGMDPTTPSVCDLEGLVYKSGIHIFDIENSLAQKASTACAAFARGQNHTARNILNAFVNQVEAQCGVNIPKAVADILITFALAASHVLL